MVILYTSPGCASCRKVRSWLKERNIEFLEKNIFTTLLNKTEVKYLLSRSENGTDDIISKRSKIIQESNIDLDGMSMDELVDFVIENPSILRRPIILNEDNFQVGYDAEEIDAFKPRVPEELLKCDPNCPKYDVCGDIPDEDVM